MDEELFPAPVPASPDVKLTLQSPKLASEGEARESTVTVNDKSEATEESRGGVLIASEPETPKQAGASAGCAITPCSLLLRLENRLAPYTYEPPKSPKALTIHLIDNKTAGRLNKAWHSRVPEITWGGAACNPCFAAIHENVIYAVAMWSCPIAGNRLTDGFRCLELRRMAIAPDAPKNTASRFLAIMVNMIRKSRPDIIKLVSYQDTAVHKGTIYKASGWTLENTMTNFISWGVTGRKGHGKLDHQAPSPKNRWALTIREKVESDELIKPSETQGDLF